MKPTKAHNLKYMLIGAIITIIIVLLVTQVSAFVGAKTATVTYSDIKVNIDGVQTTLTDLEGNAIEPVILFDKKLTSL